MDGWDNTGFWIFLQIFINMSLHICMSIYIFQNSKRSSINHVKFLHVLTVCMSCKCGYEPAWEEAWEIRVDNMAVTCRDLASWQSSLWGNASRGGKWAGHRWEGSPQGAASFLHLQMFPEFGEGTFGEGQSEHLQFSIAASSPVVKATEYFHSTLPKPCHPSIASNHPFIFPLRNCTLLSRARGFVGL